MKKLYSYEYYNFANYDDKKYFIDNLNWNDRIKNYKIKNNKIIINFENRDEEKMPYDRELEICILNRMKNEAGNYYNNISYNSSNRKKDIETMSFKYIPASLWVLSSGLYFLSGKIGLGVAYAGIALLWFVQGVPATINLIVNKKLLTEKRKYKLYKSMEEKLVKLDTLNTSIQISTTKNISKNPININTFKKFKIKELENLSKNLDNISQNDYFTEDNKTLKKTRYN